MKICITSQGDDLEAKVDPRFGRCRYFIIADTDDLSFEAMLNPNIDITGGAGIQSGQIMSDKQVDAVLTGNVGPNAFDTLKAAGIKIITGVSGTVKEAVRRFNNKEYSASEKPSVDSHFGSK